jgi:hypothetical protein
LHLTTRFAGRCGAGSLLRQPVFQQGFESGVFDGLGQIVVHAGGQAQFAIAFHGIGGHGDDRQVPTLCRLAFLTAQLPGGGIAIHAGHLAVHQDGIIMPLCYCGQRFISVTDHIHAIAQLVQHAGGHALVDRVVFGQQQMVVALAGAVAAAGLLLTSGVCRRMVPGVH